MSDIAIKVENLSKRYRIGVKEKVHDTMAGALFDFVSRPVKNLRRLRSLSCFQNNGDGAEDVIWALRDVSFDVRQGEVVGVIGPNGAGKSTLLKILSGITEPTEGRARIYGRVGSLLEVGTGFHPELTGRENIYLNGTILGMKRAEVDRKFDEIVAFSGVEKFIDTPVKRYSSGMQVRLAFSVAAHLEPEILLVDEVLAVGDAAFQKKCLGKMGDLVQEGRTVLFVSHNIPAVRRLCRSAYLFREGRVARSGETGSVIEDYLFSHDAQGDDPGKVREVPEGTARYTSWSLLSSPAGDPHQCFSQDPCTFSFRLASRYEGRLRSAGFMILSQDGDMIWHWNNNDTGGVVEILNPGIYEVRFSIPSLPIKPGSYQLHVSAYDFGKELDVWYAVPHLKVLPVGITGSLPAHLHGILSYDGKFEIQELASLGQGANSA